MSFSRVDQGPVARWWWTVDRWTLVALGLLIGFGVILTLAASPAVAERIGLDRMHFVERQLALLPVALVLMFGVSLQSPRDIRRLAVAGFIIALLLTAYTFIGGVEIKGARRWINLPGISLQPSEFVKPSFAVVAAWLFAEQKRRPRFPGNLIAILLFGVTVGLLIKQPDLGMAIVISAVWFTQFFLAGLQVHWVMLGGLAGASGLVGAYFFLPHVTSRIDRFLNPQSGDSYQVTRAMEAFANGGLWGQGPGEGKIKEWLPDAHADFVFAVAGEELGLVACLLIVLLFGFVVLRGFSRVLQENNLFIMLAATGLYVQFGLQAVINMASSLRLMPTKGMTLPFLSYGGSSLLALGLGMGMALALTRRRYGGSDG
jgi:cell division protein FtsW